MENKKKLSMAVMAHESRSEWFGFLLDRLGAHIFVDKGKKGDPENLGVWGNCRRAWMAYNPEADFHCVIQDDAIPAQNFHELANNFLQIHGDFQAFNFYFGNRQNYRGAAKEGLKNGFVIHNRPIWGVAICLSTKLIPEMIAYCDKLTGIPEDDVRIGRFLQHKKLLVCFPMPSLVDHRTGHGSLVGDPGDNRKAAHFVDAFCGECKTDCSADEIFTLGNCWKCEHNKGGTL